MAQQVSIQPLVSSLARKLAARPASCPLPPPAPIPPLRPSLSAITMATATTAYHCNAILHLPRPPHFRRLPPPLPALVTRGAASAGLGSARLGPRARASSVPPPPPFFETVEEEEERGWSDAEAGFSDEAEDEQEWAGGNGAARGEDLGADAGEDLSGLARQWPRPRELFVCNLPRRCDVQDLLELFTPHGTVLSVEVCSVLCDSTPAG